MRKQSFGQTKSGKKAGLYTIGNNNGMAAQISDYGATLVSLIVPDLNGISADIVQGFEDVSGYEASPYYMGATIGRHVGQIRGGTFTLNDTTYDLVINDQDNTLHGGPGGFHCRIFTVTEHTDKILVLTYYSKDGEAGFPGNLEVTATYKITEDNELSIDYDACCDMDTILSMTNHAYFNLDGHDAPTILEHQLLINGLEYMEVDQQSVPDGNILSVIGTPFDFTDFNKVGAGINDPDKQLQICTGYDNNWVISGDKDCVMRLCCEVKASAGQRHMQLFCNQPGLQLYTGNYLDGKHKGKGGCLYKRQSALCLEPQVCPDSLSHPHFPSAVLRAGEKYKYRSIYKFI